ncbi:MAG: type IV pilin protein [Moraxellaceae bacterium]|nr:type IV pilin protein [Moraxellaceae bacterium]
MSVPNMKKAGAAGFTLVELMVVVVIVGLLASIAYPSYKNSVVRGNRSAVQGDLEAAAAAMARFRSQNFTYSGATLGTGGVFRSTSPESGTVVYNLSFATGATNTTAGTYTIIATPVSGKQQAGDGALAINQDGARCWNKASDASCTPGDAAQRWK